MSTWRRWFGRVGGPRLHLGGQWVHPENALVRRILDEPIVLPPLPWHADHPQAAAPAPVAGSATASQAAPRRPGQAA